MNRQPSTITCPNCRPATTSRRRLMTVGELSARTGVSVKTLREYADTGLVYSVGRSPSNYRLFDKDALWCVQWIRNLRSLGLTVAEIHDFAAVYSAHADHPIGPHLAERLTQARARLDARIGELQRIRARIDEFEATHQSELAGQACVDWLDRDPRRRRASA